ncbi:RNA-binding protein [Candidatus Woesearchaeota archaeon]|nr:RNA-binding protein [Candidatus Woesearchaeota archaeon]|tara:strand:+ start:9885 stop:10571 length:687 start_codon:yes stop_codon:yes gene_type:complete
MALLTKDKSVVVPGEELASGMDYLPTNGTYRDGDKIVAARLGLLHIEGRLLKIIPFSGKYLPKRGDVIIAKVEDITLNGWRCYINSAYSALLNLRDASSEFIAKGADLTRYFTFGDYIVAGITNVTSQNIVDLTLKAPGLKKLGEGRIMHIDPNKMPRVIGKAGSMVNMIKEATDCRISVGQNGIIWIQGSPNNELVAVKSIEKISAESHVPGLTERIKKFLDKELKK